MKKESKGKLFKENPNKDIRRALKRYVINKKESRNRK